MQVRTVLPVVLLLCVVSMPSEAQVQDWVSPGVGGDAGNGDSGLETTSRAISADGRFVVFDSFADNLVENDLNGECDVFLRDRLVGKTHRVSVSSTGGDAFGSSENPSLSADGRFVAFASSADNLVSGDGNGDWDVFVRDVWTGTTERISVSTGGGDPDGPCDRPSIDAEGRLVAFSSQATNLVQGISTTIADIYVRDRTTSETTLVSAGIGGGSGELNSWRPEISPDGSTVVFISAANNLVAGDTGSVDVFVRDLDGGVTTRISVDRWGGDPNERSGKASLSHDGRVVAFWSRASDLVPGDTNGQDDIFVWDPDVGVIERVNVANDGTQALNLGSWQPAISSNGRYVVFLSDAENLVPEDANC